MSCTILVVDDSSVLRAMVKKALAMSGLDIDVVYEASNGSEALAILSEQWVDVVFTDLHMPGMGGLELIETMSADAVLVNTPVVVVSSEQSDARVVELKERGVRGYLKKPFRPEQFKQVVDAVFDAMGVARVAAGNQEEGGGGDF